MSNLEDKPLFEAVFKLENDTPAEAITPDGDISFANIQAQILANRTRYLKEQLDAYNGLLKSGELPFTDRAAAAEAIVAGKIPEGAIFSVRSTRDDVWVEECKNISGVIVQTGKYIYSAAYLDTLISRIMGNLSISIKNPVPVTFTGELLNGATGWNGFNVSPSQYYGGWSIPAGSTGYNSYVAPKVALTASLLSEMTGKRVLFIFGITHSVELKDSIGDKTKFVPYAWLNGAAVSNPDVIVINMSATQSVILFEVDITSSTTDISVALQYKINSAAASQLTFYTSSVFYQLLDVKNFIASLDAWSRSKAVPPVDSGSVVIMPAFIELFNGATRDAATGKITLPAGATGYNTYYGRFDAVHNNRNRAGETIRLVAIFNSSTKFIQTLSSYTIGVAKKLDGIQSTGAQVAGSERLRVIDDNTFMISADYAISGAASELVSVYFQLKDNTYTATTRDFTPLSASYFFVSDGDFRGDSARIINQRKITSGNMVNSLLSVGGEVFNGGVLNKGTRTLSVPAGSSGNNSYIQPFIDYSSLVKFPGARLKLSIMFATSDDVIVQSPVSVNLRVNSPAGQNNTAAEMTRVKALTSKMLLAELVYTLTGTETTLAPYLQIKSSTLRSADAVFQLADIRAEFMDITALGDTLNDQMLSFRLSALKAAIDKEISDATGGVTYYKTVTIKQDGSGDYTSLAAAIAANGGGFTALTQILYQLHSGIYPERNINFPAYITVDGIGNPWIKGELPADVDPAQIPLNQTIWMNNTATIRNVKITCKNMRYPIHSDAQAYPDLSIKNAVLNVEGCHIEHYGNAEAQAYQNSISSGVTVWSSCHAWGGGLHSGEKINCLNTDFISPTTAFYSHSNKDFDAPCRITIRGGSLRNRDPNGISALAVQNLGSGQVSFLNMEGVTIQGAISVDSNTWRAEKLENQLADRNAEMRIYLHGCSPVAVRSTNDARALQLISIDSASSAVAVSGSAVPALFGQNPVIIKGGSGYPARVLSAHSVKGEVSGGLIGQRLGDCTAVNKILTVIFDGGSPVTLTLAANYTAMSNDAVVSALNALLNDSSGRSFSIITPYNYSAPVYQSDREVILTNTSGAVILKGTAVAFNGSKLNARRATNSDTRAAIAGIALENIAPGVQGRVQSSGYIHTTYIAFTGTPPATFLATCSVNADATVSAGSAAPVLQRVSTDVYEII
ncbi:hypothetical protein [Klebsiella pneumoniae]|uniref:hypothetical protein n=1 Tax=Klebsiella pneumoniae TaxID=573 RepID=UPI002E188539|nr:hypothetical protein [Klebsiella pneumoniae]